MTNGVPGHHQLTSFVFFFFLRAGDPCWPTFLTGCASTRYIITSHQKLFGKKTNLADICRTVRRGNFVFVDADVRWPSNKNVLRLRTSTPKEFRRNMAAGMPHKSPRWDLLVAEEEDADIGGNQSPRDNLARADN